MGKWQKIAKGINRPPWIPPCNSDVRSDGDGDDDDFFTGFAALWWALAGMKILLFSLLSSLSQYSLSVHYVGESCVGKGAMIQKKLALTQ